MSATSPDGAWVLRVYTVGMPPATERALRNLRVLCSENLANEPLIEVIDLREHPEVAARERIFAVPTVVRHLPLPARKVIGDLSDRPGAIAGLAFEVG